MNYLQEYELALQIERNALEKRMARAAKHNHYPGTKKRRGIFLVIGKLFRKNRNSSGLKRATAL